MIGLELAGLRHGISTEVTKIVTAPDMKADAVKAVPAVTQAITQEATTRQAGESTQLQQPAPTTNNPS